MIYLTIIHADEKRRVDALEAIKREVERQNYLENSEKRIEELTAKFFNRVKAFIESHGPCYVPVEDVKTTTFGIPTHEEIENAEENCVALCRLAGYELRFHEYSKSWQTRSGKYLDIYVSY